MASAMNPLESCGAYVAARSGAGWRTDIVGLPNGSAAMSGGIRDGYTKAALAALAGAYCGVERTSLAAGRASGGMTLMRGAIVASDARAGPICGDATATSPSGSA